MEKSSCSSARGRHDGISQRIGALLTRIQKQGSSSPSAEKATYVPLPDEVNATPGRQLALIQLLS